MILRKLPDSPYLGLAQYSAEQSMLFAGRDAQVDTCAEIVAQADTRILMLHGQTGCGKSSFLRAGLIPGLEDGGFGYAFIRKPGTESGEPGTPVFIRCEKDPLASLARELFHYASSPVTLRTAKGLKDHDLSDAKLGYTDEHQFVERCRNPDVMLEVLVKMSEIVTHTLVVVLDQMEEVLTLNAPESDNRTRFFMFLKLFNNADHHIKLILSLRKDHSGEFLGLAQLDNTARAEFKVHLLPDMMRDEVLRAILLPTSKEELAADGSPFGRYRFSYEDGVAERIVDELFQLFPRGGVLPVMQIVCRDLYESVRATDEPWKITASLYEKTRVEGSIRRHVTKSLREPLKALKLSDANVRDEERRWRKVLYHLVKYEGDGRVSTGFMSRDTLEERATEHKASHISEMIEYLARPEVLVLRRVSLTGASFGAGATMFGLGHDVVGLALNALRIEDEAIERVEARRRKLRRVRIAVAASVVMALGILVSLQLINTERDLRRRVEAEIASVKESYAQDPSGAVERTIAAKQVASEMFNKKYRDDAELVKTRLSEALPDQTLNIAERGFGEVHGMIQGSPGIVSVSSNGSVGLFRIDAAAGLIPEQEFKYQGLFELAADSTVSATEPFPGRVMFLISSRSADPGDGNRTFRVFLLNRKDRRIYGPFGGKSLLQKFDVFNKRDSGKHIHGISTANVDGVALAGDVVSLTASIKKSSFTVALVLDREPRSDFFSHGVHLPMEPQRGKPIKIGIPKGAWETIIGHRLFSAQYPQTIWEDRLDVNNLETIEGRSLRGGNVQSAEGKPWTLRVADISAVAACNTAAAQGKCEVEHLPLIRVLSRMQVLRVYSYEQVAVGYSQQAPFRKRLQSYVVIESDTGGQHSVPAADIHEARKKCALYSPSTAPSDDLAEEAPDFVLGSLDDALFAFDRPNAIELVRIRGARVTCAERLIPDAQLFGWQFLPDQNLVLAQDKSRFMMWELEAPSVPSQVHITSAN